MKTNELSSENCVPCRGGVPSLKGEELAHLVKDLNHDWQHINEHHLEKKFKFADFQTALDFVVGVGKISEEQGHHPNINLSWGKVVIVLYTHKIDGLHKNDFILAAKIEQLYNIRV